MIREGRETNMNACIGLTIPAKAEYLHIVRLTLFGIATNVGFSFEQIEDMKVAVGEACNNVILHAYHETGSGVLEIQFEIEENGLSIHVKDEGESFDYEHMVNKSTTLHDKSLKEATVGGLGIFMMHALMDKVQVRTNRGTEVILSKMLSRNEDYA
jgi:serine/threonine-protein kinase RsbW